MVNESSSYSILSIASTMAWGLGYFGMPHILLRFMAVKDKNNIKTSRRIASVWVVISMAVAIFIGFIGNAMTAKGSIDDLVGTDPESAASSSETVVIKIAMLMSENGVILAILAGLIFAGILACTMSTSDSQLLAASSSMSENIIGGIFKIKLSKAKSMLTARIVLVVIALISIVIAWDKDSSVFEIVSFAWAGFGATFGPVMLAALFWKRANKWGIMAGMVAGGVMVFLWKFVISELGGPFAIYELLPAFIVGCAAIIIVSLVTAPPEKEITDEFEAVKAEIKAD